jgi:hypothetical protein
MKEFKKLYLFDLQTGKKNKYNWTINVAGEKVYIYLKILDFDLTSTHIVCYNFFNK